MKTAGTSRHCFQAILALTLCLMSPIALTADSPANTDNGKSLENGNGSGRINGIIEAEKESQRVLKDPLTGIVINRTITVLGKDFYHYFVTAWRNKDGDNRYTITIYERPSARWGSEIWIDYQRNQMFHTFLSPARQAARKVSEEAVDIVHRNIIENEIRRALFQSEDLGPEEL